MSDSKILLEVPPTEGFDGGTTVISIEPTSSWTWDAMPSIDNDSLYGGTMRTQVRGGWGVCEGWVGFIRDTTSRQETRWTVSEENYGKALGLFMLGQYNIDHSERFIDGGGDIVMPFHEEGLGQFRFSAWDIPASASNVPFDVKTWIGPDYNTGYMTTVSVSCVDPKDVAAMFEQMATPGNEYSIYVDVLPSTAQK